MGHISYNILLLSFFFIYIYLYTCLRMHHQNIPIYILYIYRLASRSIIVFHTIGLYIYNKKYIITIPVFFVYILFTICVFKRDSERNPSGKRVDFWLLFIIRYQKGPLLQAHVQNSLPFSPKSHSRPSLFRTMKSITLTELIFINLSLESSFKAVLYIKVYTNNMVITIWKYIGTEP